MKIRTVSWDSMGVFLIKALLIVGGGLIASYGIKHGIVEQSMHMKGILWGGWRAVAAGIATVGLGVLIAIAGVLVGQVDE